MLHLCTVVVTLVALLLGSSRATEAEREQRTCDENGKTSSLLDIAEDLLAKAVHLYPSCNSNYTSLNPTSCGSREKSLTYLKLTKKLIADMKEQCHSCVPTTNNRPDFQMDCSEVQTSGSYRSGVYTVWPMRGSNVDKPLDVYCDMLTDGGGWTVIQRRGDFSPQANFYQDWHSYKIGFGKITMDFWLGNDNIHALCNRGCELRVDLENARGIRRYAVYKNFRIEDEKHEYTLRVGNYSGTAGDGMSYHNGQPFSTTDRGHTEWVHTLRGAWWCHNFAHSHLNGLYQPGVADRENIHWWEWLENEGLAKTEMKVRPKSHFNNDV